MAQIAQMQIGTASSSDTVPVTPQDGPHVLCAPSKTSNTITITISDTNNYSYSKNRNYIGGVIGNKSPSASPIQTPVSSPSGINTKKIMKDSNVSEISAENVDGVSNGINKSINLSPRNGHQQTNSDASDSENKRSPARLSPRKVFENINVGKKINSIESADVKWKESDLLLIDVATKSTLLAMISITVSVFYLFIWILEEYDERWDYVEDTSFIANVTLSKK